MRLRSLTSELRGGEGRVCVCVSGLSFREPALFSLMSSLEPARPEGGEGRVCVCVSGLSLVREGRGGFVCASQVSH